MGCEDSLIRLEVENSQGGDNRHEYSWRDNSPETSGRIT